MLDGRDHLRQLQRLPAIHAVVDRPLDEHERRGTRLRIDVFRQDDPPVKLHPDPIGPRMHDRPERLDDRDLRQRIAHEELAAGLRFELEVLGLVAVVSGAYGPLLGEQVDRRIGVFAFPADLGRFKTVVQAARGHSGLIRVDLWPGSRCGQRSSGQDDRDPAAIEMHRPGTSLYPPRHTPCPGATIERRAVPASTRGPPRFLSQSCSSAVIAATFDIPRILARLPEVVKGKRTLASMSVRQPLRTSIPRVLSSPGCHDRMDLHFGRMHP